MWPPQGLLADLSAAPPGAVVLLHACAHNPTGVDPTPAQWRALLALLASRRLLPFFDCAYQGFATGDLDQDAAAVRYGALDVTVTAACWAPPACHLPLGCESAESTS